MTTTKYRDSKEYYRRKSLKRKYKLYEDWKAEPAKSLGGALGRVEVTLKYDDGRVVIIPVLTYEEWSARSARPSSFSINTTR